MNQQEQYIRSWNTDKGRIIRMYLNEIKKFYVESETFLLFTPPTNTKIFLNDIIAGISADFKNVINLAYCFTKNSDVSFGYEMFKNYTIEECLAYIRVDEDRFNTSMKEIKNGFIVDDVYASGKSLELTKKLILNYFDQSMEIRSGVILMTT